MVGCSLSPDGSLRVVTSTPFAVVGAEPYKEDAMLCRTESQTLLAVSGVISTIVIFLSCAPAPTRNASASLPMPAAPRREDSAASSRPDGPSSSTQSTDGGTSPTTSASAPSLRNVDWCNRSLGPNVPALYNCHGSRDVRHRAGEGIHSLAEYRLGSVTYGDLTGDGREDALVVIEGTQRPVLIDAGPKQAIGMMMVVELRGSDLYVYPATPTGDALVVSASITSGVATLVRRRGSQDFSERWRLVGEELRRDLGDKDGR